MSLDSPASYHERVMTRPRKASPLAKLSESLSLLFHELSSTWRNYIFDGFKTKDSPEDGALLASIAMVNGVKPALEGGVKN